MVNEGQPRLRFVAKRGMQYEADEPGVAIVDKGATPGTGWLLTVWDTPGTKDAFPMAKRIAKFLNKEVQDG